MVTVGKWNEEEEGEESLKAIHFPGETFGSGALERTAA